MSWRVILINLLALVISLAFLPGSSRNERLAASLTFFSILFVTLGVIYLTWNPPGAPFIAGFQARYLIPIMPLLLIACGMGIRKPSWFRLDIFYICLIAYNVFATTKIILHRYY